MLADYGSTGVTLREHPLELMRPSLPGDLRTSEELERHPDGRRVRVAGLVVARQRPATAKGVTFMLLEDEHGTINLIIPPPVYERFRLAVRSEPLLLATGRLERREGTMNVVVDRIERLERPDLPRAEIKHIEPRRSWSTETQEEADLRAVVPVANSFGRARLRCPARPRLRDRHHSPVMSGRIIVGTSSWADPGFVKEWYPPKLPAKERLPFYSQRFEAVELNSSFYAIPDRNVVRGWVDATPDHFTFDVKVHRALSRHSAQIDSLPPDLRDDVKTNERGRVLLTEELEETLARRLVEETAPLAEAGKLGAFLVQLTPGVRAGQARAERARQPGVRAALATGGDRATPPRLGLEGPHRRDARLVYASGGWRSSAWTRRRESTCRSCRR